MKMHKSLKGQGSPIIKALLGALFSLGIMLAVAGLAALIISMLETPLLLVPAAALASLVISSALSSFIIAKKHGKGGFYAALIAALSVSVLIFAIGLIFGGAKSILPELLNIAVYLAVSALFAWLATKSRGHRRRFRH